MNFNIDWDKNCYNKYIDYLFSLQDSKYKKFHSSLIPNISNVIGIRTPLLKNIAKDIYKYNYKKFLNLNNYNYYEEIIIRGLIIGQIKTFDDDLIKHINNHIKLIDNWASCDLFVANLHIVKKQKDYFFKFINEKINSNNPWERRVCFVMLLSYYIEEQYLEYIFKLCDKYNTDFYYVQMAVAWLISMCYIKLPKKTIIYLQNNKLDKFTHNKAISKIIDLKRVTKEQKEILKLLKR